MTVFDAAAVYQQRGAPCIIIAGKEYGTGSSRGWAAKGPALLGVKAVLAQSFERIHRSNLIGMGILPLQFNEQKSADSLDIRGDETFHIPVITADQKNVEVTVKNSEGEIKTFTAWIRIDTPNEFHYYQHGGILQFVLRQLLAKNSQ